MEQENTNSKLNGCIEPICEMLINGDSYRQIAAHYNVGLGTLTRYLAQPEHSAPAREARIAAGQTAADKARDVLSRQPKDMVELMWMKEQASHYRWEASKKSPKDWGDKVEIEGTVNTHHTGSTEMLLSIAQRLNTTPQLPTETTYNLPTTPTGGSITPLPNQQRGEGI